MSTESVMLSNHHHSTPLLWGRDPCLFLCMFICLNNICWRDFSFPMELSWHLPWKLISHKCFASELWILIQLIRVYPYTSATVSSFLYSCCFEIVIYACHRGNVPDKLRNLLTFDQDISLCRYLNYTSVWDLHVSFGLYNRCFFHSWIMTNKSDFSGKLLLWG